MGATFSTVVAINSARVVFVSIVLACLIAACNLSPLTPHTPSTPPTTYLQLPQYGRADCLRDASVRVDVPLWQYPGLSSPKDDSGGSSRSITGDALAFIPPCTVVRVIDFRWSEQDDEFYLLVEYGNVKGWAEEKYMEVPYAPAATSIPT